MDSPLASPDAKKTSCARRRASRLAASGKFFSEPWQRRPPRVGSVSHSLGAICRTHARTALVAFIIARETRIGRARGDPHYPLPHETRSARAREGLHYPLPHEIGSARVQAGRCYTARPGIGIGQAPAGHWGHAPSGRNWGSHYDHRAAKCCCNRARDTEASRMRAGFRCWRRAPRRRVHR